MYRRPSTVPIRHKIRFLPSELQAREIRWTYLQYQAIGLAGYILSVLKFQLCCYSEKGRGEGWCAGKEGPYREMSLGRNPNPREGGSRRGRGVTSPSFTCITNTESEIDRERYAFIPCNFVWLSCILHNAERSESAYSYLDFYLIILLLEIRFVT